MIGFNPRTHTGCDKDVVDYMIRRMGFNPRTHTGCDKYICANQSYIPCFNPRTHTGCDLMFAPPQPSTVSFQSTHPHGVRLLYLLVTFRPPERFQSTHPHGVRLARCVDLPPGAAVSIHAPTRGATSGIDQPIRERQFQSTHPHGVRQRSTCDDRGFPYI